MRRDHKTRALNKLELRRKTHTFRPAFSYQQLEQRDGPELPSPVAVPCAPRRNGRSGGFELQAHTEPQRGGDVHERVEREARNPAAEQVVDPWLRHAAVARRLRLCPILSFHACCDFLHQFCPRPQVRGLFGRVPNRIPNTRVALRFAHSPPLNNCANRLFAVSISRFEVACVFFWKACNTSRPIAGTRCREGRSFNAGLVPGASGSTPVLFWTCKVGGDGPWRRPSQPWRIMTSESQRSRSPRTNTDPVSRLTPSAPIRNWRAPKPV